MTLSGTIHLILHLAVPMAVAVLFFRQHWLRASIVMIATMVVDVDHLLAMPIYDPHRCSIGFHPLHTWPAILLYVMLLYPKQTRLVGLGLVIHMVLDALDCGLMRL
jgi:Family of unknown function (DUF6122)